MKPIVVIQPMVVLPWTANSHDTKLFKIILSIIIGLTFVLSVVIPFITVPEKSTLDKEELPTQLARVILEKQEVKKVIPKIKKPEPKPKEKEKEKEKPKEKPKPKEEKPKPKEEKKIKPVDKTKQAKQRAQAAIMQFQDDLMDMRDSLDLDEVKKNPTRKIDTAAAKVERAVITKKATTGSGGINTAALSRNTGGVALSGKEDVVVTSDLNDLVVAAAKGDSSRQAGGRSDESIRRIMDKNKGAIFSIYNRALRKDPALEGKFVFEMVVEPGGQVSSVKLISSELNNQSLERKILSRIRLIRFPEAAVATTRVNYSFDFLPY